MINAYFIVSYYKIYHAFLSYHSDILEEFKKAFTRKEVRLVRHSNKEVRLFFSYIMIMLLFQSIYLASSSINSLTTDVWGDRIHNIMQMILNISYIFLYYGISKSINKSSEANRRKSLLMERLASPDSAMKNNNEMDSAALARNSIFIDENDDFEIGSE